MGFGSILGIPPLSPVVGPRPASDVNRVFAAEFNRQQGRESGSGSESRRGLEAEEPEEEELDASPEDAAPSSALNVIA